MPINRGAEPKSIQELAFAHYLRTGERLSSEEWERKFNPYHDERGRFSSPPGLTVSYGSRGGQTDFPSVRMGPRAMRRAAPPSGARRSDPASGKTVPPGGQIVAGAGLRAARLATDLAAQAQNRAAPVRPEVRALLDRIGDGEGVGHDTARRNGFSSGYNVPFANGRYARPTKPLTRMSLAEVDDLQKRMNENPLNRRGSTPVGRYQIRRETLLGLKARLHLSDSDLFDQQMQDRLAVELLKIRGLDEFRDGGISMSTFQRQLASEWASVADPNTGRPRLANQRLGTTTAEIEPILRALRNR